MREHIEAARNSQLGAQRREHRSGALASTASLAVDLELARAELRRTRDESDRLKAKVQRSLGQQVDQSGNIELERRIRELGDELRQRDTALARERAERDELLARLSAAEDTVAALRKSLKQMMRGHSV
jgi:hypothetical protein